MLEKDVEGLEGKIPSADACIKWGELWYSAQGWSSGRRRPFVHLRLCARPGHVSAVVLISFVRGSWGCCALWSERALVPVPPLPSPLPGLLQWPGLRPAGSQEGQTANRSYYSKTEVRRHWKLLLICCHAVLDIVKPQMTSTCQILALLCPFI